GDMTDGYILDGFPRTLSQAEEFDSIDTLDYVLYISIPEGEVLKRLLGRRSCESCNTQYNVYLDDIDDMCCKCDGKIIKREDDTEETIKIRIRNYLEQTKPLVDYYKKKNLLREIDGTEDIDRVFDNITRVIAN
ncbi:MAG: nucleoside monophosphate kinase, partial [Elusimicrobiota bacterium]